MKKIKKIIKEQIKLQQSSHFLITKSHLQSKELEWAHIYHDSIRGKKALENLPLNIGRWAGNYAFFYLLNRILTDFKPKSIIEFGLGESTKFISTFLDNSLNESKLLTIEHDENWKSLFLDNFKLSNRAEIKTLDLVENKINGFDSNGYKKIKENIKEIFDLYIIDGPFGSKNYSRYDIVSLAENLSKNDDFIIIMDDYNRIGEKQTTKELLKFLKHKQIDVFTEEYVGNKSVFVIATEKYKYVTSF
ncbi:hypothetical protein [Olleya sp. R77988]|uniref:hypothetical protein n=1 Tax=Olleya sp. R77988 TaxID=3093875 RepID=UPI0037C95520